MGYLLRGALVTFLALGVSAPLQAHLGGHDIAAGMPLHIWTDPSTNAGLPGSVLFVSRGEVHVEDVAGRVHVWAIASLRPADRAVVNAFRERTERLASGSTVGGGSGDPAPPMMLWLVVVACLTGILMLRAGVPGPVMGRAAGATLAVVAVFACGGASSSATPVSPTAATVATPAPGPAVLPLASYFTAFPGHVRTRQDNQFLYVESDGLADHTLMVGIRSWQQQVPLPADYTGSNAWTIPLSPRLADQPVSARTGLFRGAIALAVNGVPIFNALNNRGDDAFLAGELDDFGGHAGRADDYHYHTAPLFLSSTVGATRPIAVALDGFLLYGDAEPDGSPMRPLDDYNGHADAAGSYHYHGTRTYPYINGGMKGVVRVSDQVEPQPALKAVRPAGTPLNGATITRHTTTGTNSWTLEYQLGGRTYRVDYRLGGGQVVFVFTDPSGVTRTEVYAR